MTKDAPAFDFYPERWLSGVAMLSDGEQLAYLRLLCHQWLEGGLPDDVAALKRCAGKGVTDKLLVKFPLCEDGQRRNARLEVIRTEQRERIAKKSEQRKAAANARWSKPKYETDAVASPPHILPQCGSNAHHPPPTTHPLTSIEVNPLTPKGDDVEKPKVKTWNPSPEQVEVASWFGRRASTEWSEKELKAWKLLSPETVADGLTVLRTPYQTRATFVRKDLSTLLNNWRGEIDRWRSWKPQGRSNVSTAGMSEEDTPWFEDEPEQK